MQDTAQMTNNNTVVLELLGKIYAYLEKLKQVLACGRNCLPRVARKLSRQNKINAAQAQVHHVTIRPAFH